MASLFKQDIKTLKGVGSVRQAKFEKLGVRTVGALLRMYPKKYRILEPAKNINDIPINESCCIKGTVISDVQKISTHKGISIYKLNVESQSTNLTITFFNNCFAAYSLKKYKEYLFVGKMRLNFLKKEMVSPEVYDTSKENTIIPIYNCTSGLTSLQIEKTVLEALSLMPQNVKEPIPQKIREIYNLGVLKEAIENIHLPKNKDALQKAKRYLIFEELLTLQLGLLSIKNNKSNINKCILSKDYTLEFLKLPEFKLTNAQKRVIDECNQDMFDENKTMRRLIQGDVGCGKTLVAAALCYNIIKNGFQAAIMAPTEILATQHYNYFAELFKNSNIRIGLLTGSTSRVIKNYIKKSMKNHEIDLVIGTHALLTDDVCFSKLGLVITDEQHRFGVNQRAKLTNKGNDVHVLVMSATPIPRTLALIVYGDLDISIIDEMPKGRQEVKTFLIDSTKRNRAFDFIKKFLNQGQQAYIVCPLVEESNNELISSEKYAKELQSGFFKEYKVGLLHGKMKPSNKDSIMKDFLEKKINILVSTTVIEVGIDVKNANIILIENAERFGLAQLHQLRGRVGRGDQKSYCILVSDSKNKNAINRLRVICNNKDGLKIADEDLRTRGPGEFFGKRQHGLPILKIANLLTNIDILNDARNCAEEILSVDSNLEEHKILKAEINQIFNENKNNYT